MQAENDNLWRQTPLLYSTRLSEITGASVYLKLENLHPSFSFKYRGISFFIKKMKEQHGSSVHLAIASGGNAGLAAACAARSYGLRCTVFIPEGVAESTLALLRREKAEVIVVGKFYAEALKAARELAATESECVMVPAYDDPTLWEGHSSMVQEIKVQLDREPDAIFCSVGGGGLLGGVIVGCKTAGWDKVQVVALETMGSDCFFWSLSLNGDRFNSVQKTLPSGVNLVRNEEHDLNLAHFTTFSSKASGSLGASEPAARVVQMALERPGGVTTATVPDELSMDALVSFANDHKFLVELACSTTLVPAYNPTLFKKLVTPKSTNGGEERPTVIFIVCGGFKIDLRIIEECQIEQPREAGATWSVRCDDGQLFTFPRSGE